MKRSLLISGATVGGLGAALVAVHPSYGADSLQRATVALAKSSTPTPEGTAKTSPAKPKPKVKSKAKPTTRPKTSAVKKVSGVFDGDAVDIAYGLVQVQITLLDGKITDAEALEAPTGRSYQYSEYAIPILREQTLAAQGSNIDGATGASYTSYGWYTSLQSALAKAGL